MLLCWGWLGWIGFQSLIGSFKKFGPYELFFKMDLVFCSILSVLSVLRKLSERGSHISISNANILVEEYVCWQFWREKCAWSKEDLDLKFGQKNGKIACRKKSLLLILSSQNVYFSMNSRKNFNQTFHKQLTSPSPR